MLLVSYLTECTCTVYMCIGGGSGGTRRADHWSGASHSCSDGGIDVESDYPYRYAKHKGMCNAMKAGDKEVSIDGFATGAPTVHVGDDVCLNNFLQ